MTDDTQKPDSLQEEATPLEQDDYLDDDAVPVETTPPVADGDLNSDDVEYAPEDELYTPDQPEVTFTEELETRRPIAEGEDASDPLSLIRESAKTVKKLLDQHSDLFMMLRDEEIQLRKDIRRGRKTYSPDLSNDWYLNLTESNQTDQTNELGLRALAREGSDWRQVIDHEGSRLRPGYPKQRLQGGRHTNEEIVRYVANRTGTGVTFDIPLYRSGIWLRLKSPTLSAIASLNTTLMEQRIQVGNDTKGHAFSNMTQTMKSTALDFCLNHVIDANVHYTTPSDLKEYIDLSDADVVIGASAVTLYPKGFPYNHSCVADVEVCQHVVKEIVNIQRLLWTDSNALTRDQRKHMAKRFARVTPQELTAYRKQHVQGVDRIVWFDNGIGLGLKMPNVLEYEHASLDWIENLKDQTVGAFNEPVEGSQRSELIHALSLATLARQYSPWVKAVYERDDDDTQQLITEEEEVINELLTAVFSDENYIDDFNDQIGEYIDDCLISMFAIPSFECPSCNTPQAMAFNKRFPHLVPIDPVSTFFTLVARKLR